MQYILTEDEFTSFNNKTNKTNDIFELTIITLGYARSSILELTGCICIHDKDAITNVCNDCPIAEIDSRHIQPSSNILCNRTKIWKN